MTSVLEAIRHYQRSIDKSMHDDARLLHCIEKLHKLNVTVEHLQETKIGHTINALRKYEGEVGYAAKALVTKWKSMVAAEEKRAAESQIEEEEEQTPEDDEAEEEEEDGRLEIHQPEPPKEPTPPPPVKESHKTSSSHKSSRHHHSSGSSSKSSKKDKERDKERRHKEGHSSGSSSGGGGNKQKSSHKDETATPSSSSSSAHKSSKKDRKDKSEKKEKPRSEKKRKLEDEIDSSAGLGFGEALGMLDGRPPGSSKTKEKITKVKSVPPPSPQPSTSKPSTSYDPSATPSLLAKRPKLEPLPDIAAELNPSTISTNYRPMPPNQLVMECVYNDEPRARRQMTDEEALGLSIQSKTARTKVYSGVKTKGGAVPSLFELCIRCLQDNIQALESTGGVPYYILKPVLERATPDQLLNIEEYNYYLLEDTDVLWESHCKRQFRGRKRQEMETWREMFQRCQEEQAESLRHLTEKLKRSKEQSEPVRTTKLAYVDSVVKPPRNVLKKQVQYGTSRAPVVSPAARVAALNGSTGSNVATVGDSRLKRVSAAIKESAQSTAIKPNPHKKAPLMMKTLNSMKRAFKR